MTFYILEGASTRSRDDNGRACKALQGSVPVPPSSSFMPVKSNKSSNPPRPRLDLR